MESRRQTRDSRGCLENPKSQTRRSFRRAKGCLSRILRFMQGGPQTPTGSWSGAFKELAKFPRTDAGSQTTPVLVHSDLRILLRILLRPHLSSLGKLRQGSPKKRAGSFKFRTMIRRASGHSERNLRILFGQPFACWNNFQVRDMRLSRHTLRDPLKADLGTLSRQT